MEILLNIIIIKRGALGDVVRTSYFAKMLKKKFGPSIFLSWVTSVSSLPLLRFNPYIDEIKTEFNESSIIFDHVYSLDDERDALEGVQTFHFRHLTGAYLDASGKAAYTNDASEWFDMGLLSRLGKEKADVLKKENRSTHAQIFSRMFETPVPLPYFFGNPEYNRQETKLISGVIRIGINPFAGGRWPSKELRESELILLLEGIVKLLKKKKQIGEIFLLGAGADRLRNEVVKNSFDPAIVKVVNTDTSVLRLASVIRTLDYLVSSDSLAMHLAIAQRVPFLAFFSPTSAAEIDDFGLGDKVVSTAPDYCSYRPTSDNKTITAERLLSVIENKI